MSRRAWASILTLALAYYLLFVWRTSFVVDGERVFSLHDDAMISMRYARNLARGEGLVWNPGERVEGFTNPLWTLGMALAHLLPLSPAKASLPVQLAGVALLLAGTAITARLGLELAGERVALGAVVLTAFSFPLVNWTLQGMEVGLLALTLGASALGLVRRSGLPVYLLMGLATLIRLDAVVPVGALLIAAATLDPAVRRRHLALGGGAVIVFVAAQLGFNHAYYGDWLPNTYYLKMTGYSIFWRVARGAAVLAEFAWRTNPVLVLLPAVWLAVRRPRPALLIAAAVVAAALYSIWAGGDAWEWWGGANRFLASVSPLFFVLFAAALSDAARLAGRHDRLAFTVSLSLALVLFNAPLGPVSLRQWLLVDPPPEVPANREMVAMARRLLDWTDERAVVATGGAGAVPYFSDRRSVDLLGKCDPRIARESARLAPGEPLRLLTFYPGHMKWDPAYSIGERRPDSVVYLWHSWNDSLPYLERDYVRVGGGPQAVYLRRDSPHIRWERVPAP